MSASELAVTPDPLLIAVMGLPASGKTSLATALAVRLGVRHLSSDLIRKELAGMRPTERPDEAGRPDLYGVDMTRRTYAALRRHAARELRTGRSVIVDATFGSAEERAALQRLARRAGARLLVLYCRADEATLRARLAARASDPAAVSDARLEHWPALRARFSEPSELTEAVSLDATLPLDAVVTQALAALSRYRAGS
jgi:predicted kinase